MHIKVFRAVVFLTLLSCLIFLACGGGSPAPKPQAENQKAPAPAHIDSRTTPPASTTPAQPSVAAPVQSKGGDQLPTITTARFETTGNTIHAIAEASDPDGDKVQLRYAWMINDKKVDNATDTMSGLNKGDHVQVAITPNDGKQDGAPKGLFVILENQPPKITPTQAQFDDPNWSLQVKASDPDGDPLEYKLVNGPPGMKVDSLTGLVTWNTDGVADGKYTATVAVLDGHGGTAQYTYQVTLAPQ